MNTIIKGSTKRGEQLFSSSRRYDGTKLSDCYKSCSAAKQSAFEDCYNDYLNTPEHEDFHICSHCTNFFSVCWFGKYEDEDALFLRTGRTNYIVLLDK